MGFAIFGQVKELVLKILICTPHVSCSLIIKGNEIVDGGYNGIILIFSNWGGNIL